VKRRKPIKRVSDKRRKQNAEYLKVRAAYLKDHPYCEVWLMEHGVTKEQVDAENGYAEVVVSCPAGGLTQSRMVKVPLSTELHHVHGRIGALLCNADHFLAVSRDSHNMIHQMPSWARENGYLA
jgi:hypothetical protein